MILNLAHRGARSLAPENTLAAARKALAVGADGWELDVNVTGDGELIVLHDDTLVRTSDAAAKFPGRAPWICTTFTLAELQMLDFGTWFVENDPLGQMAAGAISAAEAASYRGEPLLTLRQALAFTREHHWRVNIEIKAVPEPMTHFPVVEAVVALIDEMEMAPQVILSSFEHKYVLQAKRLNPALMAAALVGPLEKAVLTAFLADGTPEDTSAASCNLNRPELIRCVDGVHPWYSLVNDEQIWHLRQAGYLVIPWTVNDEREMRRLIAAGVSGIITDFPQNLARNLAGARRHARSIL